MRGLSTAPAVDSDPEKPRHRTAQTQTPAGRVALLRPAVMPCMRPPKTAAVAAPATSRVGIALRRQAALNKQLAGARRRRLEAIVAGAHPEDLPIEPVRRPTARATGGADPTAGSWEGVGGPMTGGGREAQEEGAGSGDLDEAEAAIVIAQRFLGSSFGGHFVDLSEGLAQPRPFDAFEATTVVGHTRREPRAAMPISAVSVDVGVAGHVTAPPPPSRELTLAPSPAPAETPEEAAGHPDDRGKEVDASDSEADSEEGEGYALSESSPEPSRAPSAAPVELEGGEIGFAPPGSLSEGEYRASGDMLAQAERVAILESLAAENVPRDPAAVEIVASRFGLRETYDEAERRQAALARAAVLDSRGRAAANAGAAYAAVPIEPPSLDEPGLAMGGGTVRPPPPPPEPEPRRAPTAWEVDISDIRGDPPPREEDEEPHPPRQVQQLRPRPPPRGRRSHSSWWGEFA
jgi:hypothetical protein